MRTTFTPRLDYAINRQNSLPYDIRTCGSPRQSGGRRFQPASRAYNERQVEHVVQATETATISPRAINETRFQYLRSGLHYSNGDDSPAINVLGAFAGGGSPLGNSASTTNNWEITNTSMYSRRHHRSSGADAYASRA